MKGLFGPPEHVPHRLLHASLPHTLSPQVSEHGVGESGDLGVGVIDKGAAEHDPNEYDLLFDERAKHCPIVMVLVMLPVHPAVLYLLMFPAAQSTKSKLLLHVWQSTVVLVGTLPQVKLPVYDLLHA